MLKKLIALGSLVLITLATFQMTAYLKSDDPIDPAFKTTGLPMKIPRYYWPGTFWTEIANNKGWFQEAGLNVEIIDTNPDYFGSITDMVAGKMDVNNFTLFDVISYNLGGSDLVVVFNADNSSGAEAIVVKHGIDNIRNLKGKTLGVSKGTYLEYILLTVLSLNELNINDLTLIDTPGEKALETFNLPHVDAIISWEPIITTALATGLGRKIFDTSQIPGISPSVFAFHQSFIKQRPGDVQAYVNVWHRATRFMLENPNETLEIIARIYHVSKADVQKLMQTDKILTHQENLHAFGYSNDFTSLHRVTFRMNDFLISAGLATHHLDTTTLLDDQFIRNLK